MSAGNEGYRSGTGSLARGAFFLTERPFHDPVALDRMVLALKKRG